MLSFTEIKGPFLFWFRYLLIQSHLRRSHFHCYCTGLWSNFVLLNTSSSRASSLRWAEAATYPRWAITIVLLPATGSCMMPSPLLLDAASSGGLHLVGSSSTTGWLLLIAVWPVHGHRCHYFTMGIRVQEGKSRCQVPEPGGTPSSTWIFNFLGVKGSINNLKYHYLSLYLIIYRIKSGPTHFHKKQGVNASFV